MFFFPNEKQKGSGTRLGGRQAGTRRGRGRGNHNQHILYEGQKATFNKMGKVRKNTKQYALRLPRL